MDINTNADVVIGNRDQLGQFGSNDEGLHFIVRSDWKGTDNELPAKEAFGKAFSEKIYKRVSYSYSLHPLVVERGVVMKVVLPKSER